MRIRGKVRHREGCVPSCSSACSKTEQTSGEHTLWWLQHHFLFYKKYKKKSFICDDSFKMFSFDNLFILIITLLLNGI